MRRRQLARHQGSRSRVSEHAGPSVVAADRGFLVIHGLGALPRGLAISLGPHSRATNGWPEGRVPEFTAASQRAMGSFAFDRLSRPAIVVQTQGQDRVSLENDDDSLVTQDLHWCFVALSLVTRYSSLVGVTGHMVRFPAAEPRLPGLQEFESWSAREGPKRPRLMVDWDLWAPVVDSIRALRSLALPQGFAYFSALRSFWRACQQNQVDDRYELFCRSVETLLQLQRNDGAPGFARGVASILCLNASDHRLRRLAEHYQRRSDVVHGNRFLEQERDGLAIAMMEIVARRVIRRALLDESLRSALLIHHAVRRDDRIADDLRRAHSARSGH